MLIPFLNKVDTAKFTARAFSLYVKGFGSRSVYFNGPIGTILHACYLHRSSGSALSRINASSVYISLTDAHQRNTVLLEDGIPALDLRYQREAAIRSLFSLSSLLCTLKAIEAAIKLRKHLRVFEENRWVHILAAGFQVAAGIQLGKICAKPNIKTIIWGSDHCVIIRTAILANNARQQHHLLPHGPSIGKGNVARERCLFDHVYALNAFQKAVFLKWEPTLSVSLLKNICDIPVFQKKQVEEKPFILFLNQLDLGLKSNDGFSSELDQFLTQLNRDDLLGIVVKDRRQLDKVNTRISTHRYYLGFAEFSSFHPPGTVICAVFSSGVSIDLMLAGYDLALSPNNSLIEDHKARHLLGIPAPSSWNSTSLYHVRFNLDELGNKYA